MRQATAATGTTPHAATLANPTCAVRFHRHYEYSGQPALLNRCYRATTPCISLYEYGPFFCVPWVLLFFLTNLEQKTIRCQWWNNLHPKIVYIKEYAYIKEYYLKGLCIILFIFNLSSKYQERFLYKKYNRMLLICDWSTLKLINHAALHIHCRMWQSQQ